MTIVCVHEKVQVGGPDWLGGCKAYRNLSEAIMDVSLEPAILLVHGSHDAWPYEVPHALLEALPEALVRTCAMVHATCQGEYLVVCTVVRGGVAIVVSDGVMRQENREKDICCFLQRVRGAIPGFDGSRCAFGTWRGLKKRASMWVGRAKAGESMSAGDIVGHDSSMAAPELWKAMPSSDEAQSPEKHLLMLNELLHIFFHDCIRDLFALLEGDGGLLHDPAPSLREELQKKWRATREKANCLLDNAPHACRDPVRASFRSGKALWNDVCSCKGALDVESSIEEREQFVLKLRDFEKWLRRAMRETSR